MNDMKRILSVVTLCLLVGLPVQAQGKVNFAFLHSKKKCTILHQSEGNISFTVDEGLTDLVACVVRVAVIYGMTVAVQERKQGLM